MEKPSVELPPLDTTAKMRASAEHWLKIVPHDSKSLQVALVDSDTARIGREAQLLAALSRNAELEKRLDASETYADEQYERAEKAEDNEAKLTAKVAELSEKIQKFESADMWREELDKRARLTDRVAELESKLTATVEALEMVYDKYENGDPCTENGEPDGAAMGTCVSLSYEEEESILRLIPSYLNPPAPEVGEEGGKQSAEKSFCEYCGPVCFRGACHNARVEDGTKWGTFPSEESR